MDSNKVLKAFFWVAFASFLAASIPHVAYFFRAYEPVTTGLDDIDYWIVSYAIAVSIDVTVFLLSYTVAKMYRQKKKTSVIASVWFFIICLAGLSWYINFKYAEHFINMGMISPTMAAVPFIGKLGDINPLIASCFQILAIAYTWIADKIAANESPKSAVELKAEADELELKAIEEARITAIKSQRNAGKVEGATSALTSLIHAGKSVVKEALKSESKDGQNESQNAASTNTKEPGLLPTLAGENATSEPGLEPTISQEVTQLSPGLVPTSSSQNESKTEVKTDDLNPVLSPVLGQNEEQEHGTGEENTPSFPTELDTPASDPSGQEEQVTEELEQVSSEFTLLNGYSVIASWVHAGRKSATFDEVSQAVNLSVKVLKRRVSKGVLKTTPRNPDFIVLSSVLDWLKSEQNGSKNGSIPALKLVQREQEKVS
jgi:hypothetical protein